MLIPGEQPSSNLANQKPQNESFADFSRSSYLCREEIENTSLVSLCKQLNYPDQALVLYRIHLRRKKPSATPCFMPPTLNSLLG